MGVDEADPGIRKGDEVVVLRDGEAVAVGVARMSGEQMVQCSRGEAVKVRSKKQP